MLAECRIEEHTLNPLAERRADSSCSVRVTCPTHGSGRSLWWERLQPFLEDFGVRETSLPVSVEDFSRYELETPSETQGRHSSPPKIFFHVLHVVPEKVEGMGVVVFDRLRDIYDVEMGVVI